MRRLPVFLLDGVLINLSFALSYVLRYQVELIAPVGYPAGFDDYIPVIILFNLAYLIMFRVDGVYRRRSWFEQMASISNATAKVVVVVWAVIFATRPLVYSRLMIGQAAVIAVALMGLMRWFEGLVEAGRRRRGIGSSNVLIVGAGEMGRSVMRTIVARPELGYRCIGFVDDDPETGTTDIGRFSALGSVANVANILRERQVDEVVITLPWSAQPTILELVRLCHARRVRARVAPSLLQINLSQIDVNDFGGIPLISAKDAGPSTWQLLVKRAFDIVVASAALLLSAPIVLLFMLLIRLESPGSPVYSHVRVGKNGRPFRLYKLRSMRMGADEEKGKLLKTNEVDGPLFKMKADPRRTRVGTFIRRYSIDESLQFWNVLKGDMSVVGPRPHLPSEIENYKDWQRERQQVMPGITGLSQISGRSELSFDETCLLDVYYVENWSLSLDVKIALLTPAYLLSARGAY